MTPHPCPLCHSTPVRESVPAVPIWRLTCDQGHEPLEATSMRGPDDCAEEWNISVGSGEFLNRKGVEIAI